MFEPFPKIPRLRRDVVVTEKIDGTNAAVVVASVIEHGVHPQTLAVIGGRALYAQSRSRLIVPGDDNFGFAEWVSAHAEELVDGLGEGRHFGEWWGQGIQRGYGLDHRRFSLFNTGRWLDPHDDYEDDFEETGDYAEQTSAKALALAPGCCHVVPILAIGPMDAAVDTALFDLKAHGSKASRGYYEPEGVVVYHMAARQQFKVLIERDDVPKTQRHRAEKKPPTRGPWTEERIAEARRVARELEAVEIGG